MTRETKIGLVVACSFLCLVGVVVASKWRRGDDPSEEQTVTIATNKPAQNAADPKGKSEPPKSEKPGTLPMLPVADPTKKAELSQGDKKPAGEVPPPFSFNVPAVPPPLTITPPSPLSEDDKKKELERLAREQKSQPQPGSFEIPVPIQYNESKPLVSGPAPVTPAPMPSPPNTFGPPAALEVHVKPMPPNTSVKDQPLIPPPAVGIFGTDPVPGPKPITLTPTEPIKPGTVGTVEVPPSLTPLTKEPVPPTPPGLSPFAPMTKEPAPVSPPPFTPLPKDPAPLSPPSFTPMDPAPVSPPPFAPLPKEPAPTIGPKELPSVPPIGTNPTIPPISVGGNKPALPMVRDTSVATYESQPGENTFARLSQRLYGTDKYGDALLAYNRAHSGAVKNGANFNFSQPILNPGQQVLHPPKEELERDYRFFIREASVSPMQTPSITPPPVKLATPSPLNPGVATVSIPPSIGAGGEYRVANPNGESILDIAESRLGNRGRWTDIYRLNQGNSAVQPQFRIPAGTVLKMPAN